MNTSSFWRSRGDRLCLGERRQHLWVGRQRQVVVSARQDSGGVAKAVSRVVGLVPVLWMTWSSVGVARQPVSGETGTAVQLFSHEKNDAPSFWKREKASPSQESMAAVMEYYTNGSSNRKAMSLPDEDNDAGRQTVVAVIVAIVCAVAYAKYAEWKKSSYDYGIEKELRDFEPIRENASLAEEEKEAMRREALRRIARAKRAEENFRRNAAEIPIGTDAGFNKEEEQQLPLPPAAPLSPAAVIIESNMANEDQELEDNDDESRSPEAPSDDQSCSPSASVNPGILAIALFSVIAEDVSALIPKLELERGRVLGCSYSKRGTKMGKTMSVGSYKKRIVRKPMPSKSTIGGSDILLAPIAPLMKSVPSDKKTTTSAVSAKYSPFADLHKFVSKSKDHAHTMTSDRDPFHALTSALLSFKGFQVPKTLDKYDPSAGLEQIEEPAQSDDRQSDPIVSFIKKASEFDGPKISKFMTKYDPLSAGFDTKIIPEKGTSQYSVFQALLNSHPTGSSEYSILHALLHAKPTDTGDDPWKALVDARPPDVRPGEVVEALDRVVTYLKAPLDIDLSKYDMIHNMFGHDDDTKE